MHTCGRAGESSMSKLCDTIFLTDTDINYQSHKDTRTDKRRIYKPNPYKEKIKKEVISFYLDGELTPKEIAKEFKLSRPRIYQIIKEYRQT